ncbi:TPR-like protein [Xylariaceae sp. FL0255]|nr:TPR-like protein [Xylariaceae sp. FL0255]
MPLRLLFPDEAASTHSSTPGVDVFAVHGLNPRSKPDAEHAWDTWRTPAGPKGHLWLRDDLPAHLPGSRIFLYEYDATVVYGKDRDTFVGKANELLEAIRVERDGDDSRPIIFFCHSMGGLLVKQALINAHNNPKYTSIKIVTSGLAFFATPHNGGDWKLVLLGGIAAKLATTMGFQKGDDVLETLKQGSIFSDIMQEHWRHQLLQYNILSFWGGLDNVVPRESARLGLPGDRENVVKLNADHSGVCKFGSSQLDQDNFKLVRFNLKELHSSALQRTTIKGGGGHTRESRYYIPLPKNSQFTGRHDVLRELQQKLFIRKACQTFAIVGLGGVGKTQVALRLAHWVKETQPTFSIFWLPVMSLESFEQAYAEISRLLKIEIDPTDADPKYSVRRYLEERAGNWLLVVDNADDVEILFSRGNGSAGIYKFLPRHDHGLILYTTRSSEVAHSVAGTNVIDLQQLAIHEAETLMKAIVKSFRPKDEAKISDLIEELHYHPLALTNAAAYLNMTKSPVQKYLDLLHGTEKDLVRLMTREFYDSSRYEGSQNAIARSDPAAAELLSFISCIEPKAIPQSLLPDSAGSKSVENAIGTLCQYSFLVRRGDSDIFDMHALVHLATRIWTGEHGEPQRILNSVIQHIEKVFDVFNDTTPSSSWQPLLPHTLSMLKRSEEVKTQARYDLLHWVGWCLCQDHRFKEALKMYKKAYKRYQSAPKQTYTSANQVNGRLKSVNSFRQAVQTRQTKLTKKDSRRLLLEHSLGSAYLANGQIKKAIHILERVVAFQNKVLSREDSDRLASEHQLANAYRGDGRAKEAIQILKRVVAIKKRTLAEDNHSRLKSETTLAAVYIDSGQTRKGSRILKRIVATQKRTLAEGDYSRLTSEYELARAYDADGRVNEAIQIYERVVAIEEKISSEKDYARWLLSYNLGYAYFDVGRFEDAIRVLENSCIAKVQGLSDKDRVNFDRLLKHRHILLVASTEL